MDSDLVLIKPSVYIKAFYSEYGVNETRTEVMYEKFDKILGLVYQYVTVAPSDHHYHFRIKNKKKFLLAKIKYGF